MALITGRIAVLTITWGLAFRTPGKHGEAETLFKCLLDASLRTEGATLIQGSSLLLDDLGKLFTATTKRYDEAELNFARALAARDDMLKNRIRATPGEPVTLDPEVGVGDTSRYYGIL